MIQPLLLSPPFPSPIQGVGGGAVEMSGQTKVGTLTNLLPKETASVSFTDGPSQLGAG